jgi:3-oxoacyl-[acyl-carrier-protein] synthase-3
MKAAVRAIEYYLPDRVLSNDELSAEYGDWSGDKIQEKTGISERHIAADGQCASDLAVCAAQKLFSTGSCRPEDIDYLLLCTQSPDYFLPTTACVLQDRLGLPTSAGALDFNLGCSGFVYGLGLAKGLVETEQAQKVLLITAETYSKFIEPGDRSVRTIFGDAAAATLIDAVPTDGDSPLIGPFVNGTDGRGAPNLIVAGGALRQPRDPGCTAAPFPSGALRMNGPEIFNFTLRVVPQTVKEILSKSCLGAADIDLFIFHQANQFMLGHLQRKLKIPDAKFWVGMKHCGNTVSSTIPIALKQAACEGRLSPGDRALLVGFGVGYSWGATVIRWMLPTANLQS